MATSRRTVTIVFTDVAGSTEMAERLDPEVVRRIMRRYFDEARAAHEAHGGRVEKFIGDAVMAVFGIPQLHEDDGLRAVRAAAELRDRVERLNEELEASWGVRIAVRTGVNTGEVVAGDPAQGQAFATGDAVNVAARLEQVAGPGEILIGEETRRLVGDAVRLDEVAPLELKGKAAPVPAWRLAEVLPDAPAFMRKLDAPFVGREGELSVLVSAFERVESERSCQVVTLLGPPGVGKSRLARELLTTIGTRARVVIGRCLPYGEGITYWPLAEIVRQVAGRDAAGLAEIVAGDEAAGLISSRIAGAIGLADAAGRSEEISWAVRKLLEALSSERPLVVVLDDIHWAEPTFLDLVEYAAGFTSGPVLLLAIARPDLLEQRPSWAAPRPNAATVGLEPLSEDVAGELVASLLGGRSLPDSTRARIVEASEGNPLFVEQMLAFQAEDSDLGDELAVPPTIHALLAARIDRLPAGERAVIERASVEGRSFHRGAVSALLPESERTDVGARLMSLVRKDFVRPDRAYFPGDDGFRFAHILVRDAAYGAIPKELRAGLHEHFADWLEGVAAQRISEYHEILGYHLEQAHRYRVELGLVDAETEGLARRASIRLTAAAERAASRADRPAQINLLSRTAALLAPDDALRREVLSELGDSLTKRGEFAGAESVLAEALDAAAAAGDGRTGARARISLAELRYATEPGDIAEHYDEAERGIQILEEAGDDLGLARAWDLRAHLDYGQGKSAAAQDAWERSIEHARQAGRRPDELAALARLASVALWGPTHRHDAWSRCEQILERVRGVLEEEAHVLGLMGCLRALEGRFADARALQARRMAILDELGLELTAAWESHITGLVELLAADGDAAELVLRRGYETLERLGAKTQLQVVGSYLAQALTMQGRYGEAAELALDVEALDPTGIAEIASARCARAKAAARLGRTDEGEELARSAVALVDRTDFLIDRADARMDLAEVLGVAGRRDEAADQLRRALELHEEKGNAATASRARTLLDGL
jgi:class 3 adenylate cyclase/tetratricopeptide (TPR) repeat protein